MVEAFSNTREKWQSRTPASSGLGKKKKDKFTINMIHFVKEGAGATKDPKMSKVASETRGEYRKIKGMSAIQSYVTADSAQ